MRDGAKCGQPSSYVYKTAFATRLVCDDCAQELRMVKGAIGPPPLVEYALLELVPARRALLEEKQSLLEEKLLMMGKAERDRCQIGVLERSGILIAYWLWVAVGYGVVVTLVGAYEWFHR
jgi:hypothetical protein